MRKKAVALKYDSNKDIAPTVVAKGVGEIANKIIEVSKEYKVPIVKNSALADMLYKIELENAIPEDLYELVATIIVYIYSQSNDKKGLLSKLG
jgi:flagellar biosynthesis protein